MDRHQNRNGHAAIAAIISDIENYLPPPNNSKPGYSGCRTTYGLLTRFHVRADKAETQEQAEKEYKELQKTENDLRRRINNLESKKGVPKEMTRLLDELRDSIAAALAQGITTDFFLEAAQAQLDEEPEVVAEPKENRKMVTERRFKIVWDELQDAKKRIRQLNDENNVLQLKVMRLEAARGPMGNTEHGDDGSGEPPKK
ncbi:hypothetical protein T440DRAFT_244680 [Plenodomus tracheiphilus IPT5]|uniref:Uncharacterized protein n=1 Tax=Plenodomus tracheiphilus IPT5 TaxID=1408161 RepID=A0A6A7BHH9_9PLEO|nr:hypothetical protein T440DRAFT_244680 [Plenodomus tracheiphilus IPT5]